MTNTTPAARTRYGSCKAEHVGSFLRNPEVKAARAAVAAGTLSRCALTEIENTAIRTLIAQQKTAGLQSVTDGETRRAWWHFDFMEHLRGAEGFEAEQGMQFKGVITKPHNVRIIDRIAYNPDHPQFDQFKFLRDEVGDDGFSVAKMTLPSPNMFMRPNLRLNEVYGHDVERYVEDLGLAYQKSIRQFYDLGCRSIQLDDVFWAYLVDQDAQARERELGMDPQRLGQLCVDTINLALADKPDDLVTGMHICRGNFSSTWHYQGGYDFIEQFIFKGLKQIDRYYLEYDDERSGGFAPLAELQGGNAEVVLGLVTSKTEALENADNIIARIEEAARYLPLTQLALSPQCGFSSTEEGNKVNDQAQWRKIQLIQDICKQVWGQPIHAASTHSTTLL